jgi:hypothetical protein
MDMESSSVNKEMESLVRGIEAANKTQGTEEEEGVGGNENRLLRLLCRSISSAERPRERRLDDC